MMISVAIFWLSLLGFAAVTLSMPTHYRQLRPEHRPLSYPAQWCFRLVGFGGLGLGAALCIQLQGLALGLVGYLAMLTVAALLVALLLSYRPLGLFRLIVITFLAWLAVTIFLQADYTAA